MKLVRDSENILILDNNNRVIDIVKESEIGDAQQLLKEQKRIHYTKKARKANNVELLQYFSEMIGAFVLERMADYPDFDVMMECVYEELLNRLCDSSKLPK
jgi:deoxyadenosine/deoxycytidine kinase